MHFCGHALMQLYTHALVCSDGVYNTSVLVNFIMLEYPHYLWVKEHKSEIVCWWKSAQVKEPEREKVCEWESAEIVLLFKVQSPLKMQ